jgi:predicted nicotinamide N-methyase
MEGSRDRKISFASLGSVCIRWVSSFPHEAHHLFDTYAHVRCVDELPLSDGLLLFDGVQDLTGVKVWPGAFALLSYLAFCKKDGLCWTGKRVLELGERVNLRACMSSHSHLSVIPLAGCGTGLVGLFLAQAGAAECVLTDGDAEALRLASHNTTVNNAAGVAHCTLLQWGAQSEVDRVLAERKDPSQPLDAVVAADVVYASEAVAPLLWTAAALLRGSGAGVGGRVFLGYVPRCMMSDSVMEQKIHDVAGDAGLRVVCVTPLTADLILPEVPVGVRDELLDAPASVWEFALVGDVGNTMLNRK